MPYKFLLVLGVFTLVSGILYSLTPQKYRYLTLLAISTLCIVWMSGFGAIFILTTILTTYFTGILMDNIVAKNDTTGLEKAVRKQIKAKVKRQKKFVVLGYIVINLGILLTLKYFNFFSISTSQILNLFGINTVPLIFKLAVPFGLSYYTLQAISYVIDVFRGKYQSERNVLKLALFIAYFPQLHEGPFGRYDLLMPQMCSGKRITVDSLYKGIVRILWGMFEIFMVANRAAIISDSIFSNYQQYGGFTILLGGIAFTLQLYAEFVGYIDIVRGVSNIFGIELTKNFDMPFLAENVADFWRRWHISLGSFFRDYVFYPVSTSQWLRKLTKKMSFDVGSFVSVTVSLLVVWFLTGLWHGASEKYICYGLYYFLLILSFNILSPMVTELMLKHDINQQSKILKSVRIIKTWIFVLIGMIMFRAENMTVFFHMMGALFHSGEHFPLFQVLEGADFAALILSTLTMIAGAVLKLRHYDIAQKYNALMPYQRYIVCFFLFCVIMIFGAYGLDYIAPDPIYGGF